jgi:hypothetical protein
MNGLSPTMPTLNLFEPIDKFKDFRNGKGQFTTGNTARFQAGNKAGLGNHDTGRPTKYTDEILKKAEAYLEKCKVQKHIPFTQELALELKISRETINQWRTATDKDGEIRYRAFSDICEDIDTYQEVAIIKRGLAGKAPSFAQFLLETKHKYIKTEKQILIGEKDNPVREKLEIEIVEAAPRYE